MWESRWSDDLHMSAERRGERSQEEEHDDEITCNITARRESYV